MRRRAITLSVLAAGLTLPAVAFAEGDVTAGQFTANNVWMMLWMRL